MCRGLLPPHLQGAGRWEATAQSRRRKDIPACGSVADTPPARCTWGGAGREGSATVTAAVVSHAQSSIYNTSQTGLHDFIRKVTSAGHYTQYDSFRFAVQHSSFYLLSGKDFKNIQDSKTTDLVKPRKSKFSALKF